MALAASVVLAASLQKSLALFYVGFIALFVLSGVGNGSTYKMIPAIFRGKSQLRVAAGADPEPPSTSRAGWPTRSSVSPARSARSAACWSTSRSGSRS